MVLLLATSVVMAGCMENDIVAPEEITDPSALGTYYPARGANWDSKTAAEIGWNQSSLTDAIEFAVANEASTPADLRAFLEALDPDAVANEITGPVKSRGGTNGLIVHRGYIVAEWGDTTRTDMVFGVAMPFVSTAIGLALDRGLILAVDDRVGEYVTDDGYLSPHNTRITWRQTLHQTTEWVGEIWDRADGLDRNAEPERIPQTPGTFWEANSVRADRAALSITTVWGESLTDVLDREILTPIGASRAWRWQGYRDAVVEVADQQVEAVAATGRWGGGLWISTRDLARFGVLFMRGGMWREEQLLSAEFVTEATTASTLNPNMGYMWTVNSEAAVWPSASAESFGATGLGANLLWVDPANELVVVVRWIEDGAQDGVLQRVLAALN
jgi:CubicO group peptidase (beta-lactamase class C family)